MSKDLEQVKGYFYNNAAIFDSIYSGKRGPVMRWVDRTFRSDMYERFYLSMQHSDSIEGKTVLDVGCGSGRYSVEFAKRGAAKVVGIDLAERMIQLAGTIAHEQDVNDQCEFFGGDFLNHKFDDQFDIIIAMGVFDYLQNPLEFITKMCSLSRGKVLASFPSYHILRTPIRKVRYRIKRCPVYFYRRSTIDSLLKAAHLENYSITKINGAGMDYFVSVDV